jgi:hypothetical protein
MDASTRFDTQIIGALPVIVNYFERLKLGTIINDVVPWEGDVPLGTVVEIMIAKLDYFPQSQARLAADERDQYEAAETTAVLKGTVNGRKVAVASQEDTPWSCYWIHCGSKPIGPLVRAAMIDKWIQVFGVVLVLEGRRFAAWPSCSRVRPRKW